jgi:hypothetical protein
MKSMLGTALAVAVVLAALWCFGKASDPAGMTAPAPSVHVTAPAVHRHG